MARPTCQEDKDRAGRAPVDFGDRTDLLGNGRLLVLGEARVHVASSSRFFYDTVMVLVVPKGEVGAKGHLWKL